VNVEKTEFISPDQVMSIANKLAIAIQGNLIPMVYLSDVLGMQEIAEVKQGDEIRVIIVKHGHQLIAFVVDDFHGVKLMVIKSLGDYLRRVRNIAGTSIMGNGEVAFILHVPDLIASASSGTKGTFKTVQALVPATKVEILVVEDSMMTREFERNILESVGYSVDVAVDGLDGLEKMGEKDYNLVVSDIEMPRMNGFEFVSSFKKNRRFQHIPTIIVTSLDSEEEKQKGLAAGADKYIVKSAFDKDTLLQAVTSLVGQ
jgi:two-component system chemotaxis sensor kinase CheA